jgi:hypothetical protein
VDDGFDGSIHRHIINARGGTDPIIFELPKVVDKIHKGHWIQHYPIDLCPSNVMAEEKLYITPFDCRGRDFIINLVKDADEYVFISTESFTDEDFSAFLENISTNKAIQIRVLTGTKSMDFTDRVDNMLRELLSREIDVRTTTGDLHAKLVITDKALMVSSINLNRINLGFYVSKQYWRENTETFLVCKKPELVQYARTRYLEIFNASYSVKEKLCEKLQDMVKDMFIGTFGLRSTQETKALFAKFILKEQLDFRKLIIKLGTITKKLMNACRRNTVEKQDFISALVLHYLSERKQDYEQLKEKLDVIGEGSNLQTTISRLELARLVEKENDYYKINVQALNP